MHSWDRRQTTPAWQIVLGVTLGIVVLGVAAFYARIWIIQHMFENMTECAKKKPAASEPLGEVLRQAIQVRIHGEQRNAGGMRERTHPREATV